MRKNLLVLFTVVLSLIMVACTDTMDVNFQFIESEVTIKVGDTYTLEYDLTENYEVEYTLSETGIISISESSITALAVGEVTINATVVGLDVSDSITIIVEPADDPVVDVDSVTISGDATGFIGEEITLTATVLPSDATNKDVTWTSSDETLATVDEGIVTLLEVGTVTITATADGIEATHDIEISAVVIDVESITISGDATGFIGDEITLTATVLPLDATNKDVTWTSSDETLATVDGGIVTLLQEGTVTITATADGIEKTHEIAIIPAPVEIESIEIIGDTSGFIGDSIELTVSILPVEANMPEITWSVNITAFADVTDGMVSLNRAGTVIVTANANGISTTHEIVIHDVSAMINDAKFASIQDAIDAALDNDVIIIFEGSYDEALVINKSNISFEPNMDDLVVLTNLITITGDQENISIEGFEFTGNAQIKSTGILKGFSFKENYVYDTNLSGSGYLPVNRVNVNAFIQFYRLASSDLFGDIHIELNKFENIQSDIISLDRTMVDSEINILNNEFKNFDISAIRFDGGYNNGTYNIKFNTFMNDELSAYSAITFRAIAPTAGNIQNIYIDNNYFENIGNTSKDRDGDQPGSGVITFSTFNGNDTNVFIRDNYFKHTFNSVHLRGEATNWAATVSGNTFEDVLGYVYFENVKLATYSDNIFLDRLGEVIEASRLDYVDAPTYLLLQIEAPVLESFEIIGETEAEVTDQMILELAATPPYFVFDEVVWTSSDETVATVDDGVVTFLTAGSVTISATHGPMVETLEIVVTEKMAAFVGELSFQTIQAAIDFASDGDTIVLNSGTFDEYFTINKPLILNGSQNHETTLTGLITIAPNLENIHIANMKMTGDFQVKSTGTLKNFNFLNNRVFDTNLLATPYVPNARTNVNAIIQLYAGAGTNVFGDIFIEDNVFNNIQSDIIAIDRTMIDTQISIINNEFLNFKIGAIRFDGGYNNGTYNIDDNIFANDQKQAEAAIVFRAYSPSSGELQIINIRRNTFENIGNELNNPTAAHPASAVIATSTYNSQPIDFNITDNMFINTHNSIHMRKNEVQPDTHWDVDILNNTFINPTGYVYMEDSSVALFDNNQFPDVDSSKISDESTANSRLIKVTEDVAEYVVIRYVFNVDTESYDIVEEFNTGVVGSKVVINANPELGFFTEFETYEGIIKADGSLVIEIYYDVFMDSFIYELDFNGGNTVYADREAMVNDWLADYNTFGSTAYTIETLPMGAWGNINIHTFFYDARFRDKWLWVASYLSVVGSSTNKGSAANIVSRETVASFESANADYKYAFSYEVRGFMAGRKYTENANWQSADYSVRELKYGFWSYFNNAQQQTEFISETEVVVLPTDVYLENYEFMGWYNNPEFSGDRLYEITEETTLYARWEEKNPVAELIITNPVEEMYKGDVLLLEIDILPMDAFNKLLLFYTSDNKVITVTPDGEITAVNAGSAIITVTNHNGDVVTTMEVIVYPNDDITLEFSEGFNGYIEVGQSFTMQAVGFGKDNETTVYSYVAEEDGILELDGTNTFEALLPGSTFIDVFDGTELIYTYQVFVQGQMNAEDRVDELLYILGNANNAVVNGLNVITYYTASQEWSDPRYESVNLYLFDDFIVDSTTYPADPTKFSNRLMTSVEFVLIHDTANLNGGLASHGSFFANPSNSIGIHYTTGDYGIIDSLPDAYVGWHAGDGTGSDFQWHQTGVMAPNTDKPVIDISVDGFFTFNGEKSTVQAPRGDNNQILDKSYFTYQGPTWDIMNGEYVIGTHWFAKTQQARGVIASRGGNLNSLGIEMNVNRNADIIDTVQRTAKLVANLLETHDLPNHRVIMHNTTDGKGDPYTLNNTIYNGTWYFDRFMEHVAIEREVLANFSDAIITFTSESSLVSNTGRVIEMPEFTTEVEYTITVEIGGVSKSVTLTSVIPGLNTWHQNYGFFAPTQSWAKADYRN